MLPITLTKYDVHFEYFLFRICLQIATRISRAQNNSQISNEKLEVMENLFPLSANIFPLRIVMALPKKNSGLYWMVRYQ